MRARGPVRDCGAGRRLGAQPRHRAAPGRPGPRLPGALLRALNWACWQAWKGSTLRRVVAGRPVTRRVCSSGWVTASGSCRAAGAGGRAALAPRAAAPALLPTARRRDACGGCGVSAAIVQCARGLVLPMLLPMAPQVPPPSSCKQLEKLPGSIRCMFQLGRSDKLRSTAWPPVHGQTTLTTETAARRRADQSVQLAEQDVEAGHARQAGQAEHTGQAAQGSRLDRTSVSLQLGACFPWTVRLVHPSVGGTTARLCTPSTVWLPTAGHYVCPCSARFTSSDAREHTNPSCTTSRTSML